MYYYSIVGTTFMYKNTARLNNYLISPRVVKPENFPDHQSYRQSQKKKIKFSYINELEKSFGLDHPWGN